MHELIRPYADLPLVAIDTENTGLDWWDNSFKVGGYSLYAPSVGSVYVPVRHETMFDTNYDAREIVDSLAACAPKTWIVHNRNYDENAIASDGLVLPGKLVDTMPLWWSVDAGLPSFALKRLGVLVDKTAAVEELRLEDFIRKNKLKRYTQVPVSVMAPYAEQDARLTYLLWELGIRHLPAAHKEIHEKEQAWGTLLSRMAAQGLPVDADLCTEQIDSNLAEAHKLRIFLAKATGMRGLNPGSPQQVQRLAGKYGVRLDATDMDSLWASDLPKEIKSGIVRYRQCIHDVGSYLEPFVRIARNARDGRVHSTFRTTTFTGRVATGQPINLQGLPRAGSSAAHGVRNTVRYKGGGRAIGFADYAQEDVRVGAHYSRDPRLTEVLRDPAGDVHTMAMNMVHALGIPISRSDTKRLVFGSQFDIGPEKFAADVSGLDDEGNYRRVTPAEAAIWLRAYRKQFPAAQHVSREVQRVMDTRGYILTWDGRMIRVPPNGNSFSSFAWLVQASSAQVIKTAMLQADDWMRKEGYKSEFCLQVHDEVVLDSYEDEVEPAMQGIAHIMATVWPGLRVPLFVQPEVGNPSWAEKKKIGVLEPQGG